MTLNDWESGIANSKKKIQTGSNPFEPIHNQSNPERFMTFGSGCCPNLDHGFGSQGFGFEPRLQHY